MANKLNLISGCSYLRIINLDSEYQNYRKTEDYTKIGKDRARNNEETHKRLSGYKKTQDKTISLTE